MASIEEQLSSINSKLAKIESTGENTLAECRKTNGRVTKLEDSHNETKLELAVLDGVLREKIKVLDRDLGEVTPKIEEANSFITTLKGNWQGISLVVLIAFELAKYMKWV